MNVLRNLKMPPAAIVGNFVFFQVLWFAAILGAARGVIWPVLLVLAMLVGWALAHERNVRQEVRMLMAGLVVGAIAELVWLNAGVISYRTAWSAHFAPIWILALWAGFAVSFNYSLGWLKGRPFVAAAFGGFGSAGSVVGGVRLGAAEAPEGLLLLAICYGVLWSLIVPMLAWWAQRGAPAQRVEGRRHGSRSIA
ncbi:DUF2878 domain-containing protein [Alcanivorax sp. JB21]|uniref:DUF2878 domain-containing protein n=1 Tax=Alcanivorax limicola TaxID=2874102 RepID=UPI001CBD7C03|nr:DUF2878 domain-containing protein [Alcanivorax limicola]MBZ2188557.1 DUF2878 domain-containing protein [Alcanivorax limicola]